MVSRYAWKRALAGALLVSVVGAEFVLESRDSSALARGSDPLAIFASCGAAAQGAAVATAAGTCGLALGLRGLSWWKRGALAAVGFAVLLLAVNTIGHDGKNEVIVEHLALFKVAELSLRGHLYVLNDTSDATKSTAFFMQQDGKLFAVTKDAAGGFTVPGTTELP